MRKYCEKFVVVSETPNQKTAFTHRGLYKELISIPHVFQPHSSTWSAFIVMMKGRCSMQCRTMRVSRGRFQCQQCQTLSVNWWRMNDCNCCKFCIEFAHHAKCQHTQQCGCLCTWMNAREYPEQQTVIIQNRKATKNERKWRMRASNAATCRTGGAKWYCKSFRAFIFCKFLYAHFPMATRAHSITDVGCKEQRRTSFSFLPHFKWFRTCVYDCICYRMFRITR